VTLDQVQVMEGGHVLSRFAEVEAEVVSPEGDLRRVDRLLAESGRPAERADAEDLARSRPARAAQAAGS
jgi:hypothetical protein